MTETSSPRRFAFVSAALPENTFGVVRFRGLEGLSRCYRFEVELLSEDAGIDHEAVLQSPAVFTILRPEGDIPFHGILSEFEQLRQFDRYTFYRAVLAPKLWWLSLTHHNQVFLDRTAPQLIEACLKDGGLLPGDFQLRLQGDYPAWEYVCQYRESHLDFVSRWMEREGLYYFFEQADSGEKVVVTDSRIAHGPMPQGETLRYRDPAGLEYWHREEVVAELAGQRRLLPRTLTLRDYNDQLPSLDLTASVEVTPKGRGEVYHYGDHFRTQAEGQALARVRAEELRCGEQRFSGESSVPYLRPGYTFVLHDHYRDDFNRRYLALTVHHEGSQAAYLTSGLGLPSTELEQEPYYRNRFEAIPTEVQFRPPQSTGKARIYGTLSAQVDAAGSGQYAELDAQGRYKVTLPFDRSERAGGKASAWLRMMQPYAGAGHGMHFPLHKGTEVLLTFIDGDPDRPVIAGAVPNPETPSPVQGANQTMAVLQTGGANRIAIEDKAGSERILLHVPSKGTWIRMGAPNDPPAAMPPTTPPPSTSTTTTTTAPTSTPKDKDYEDLSKSVSEHEKEINGIKVEIEGSWDFHSHNKHETVSGNDFEMVIGSEEHINLGNYTHIKMVLYDEINFGWGFEVNLALHQNLHMGKQEIGLSVTKIHGKRVEIGGEVHRLGGDVVKLAGQTTSLAVSVSDLSQETNTLSGSVNRLASVTRKMQGNEARLAVKVNQLAGNFANIAAVQMNTTNMNLDNVLTDTRNVTNRTQNIGRDTLTTASRTEVGGQASILNALTTYL